MKWYKPKDKMPKPSSIYFGQFIQSEVVLCMMQRKAARDRRKKETFAVLGRAIKPIGATGAFKPEHFYIPNHGVNGRAIPIMWARISCPKGGKKTRKEGWDW